MKKEEELQIKSCFKELKKLKSLLERNKFEEYDKRGVRCYIRHSDTGSWAIECYRSKLPSESKGESDWRMIRVGHIQTYETRKEAEEKVFELAESICQEFNF